MSKRDLVMANKMYDIAARPWKGDNTSLKAEIVGISRVWPEVIPFHTKGILPVNHTEKKVTQYLTVDEKQQEADTQMQTLCDCFTTNIDG